MAEMGKELSGVSFIIALLLLMNAPVLCSKDLPNTLLPNTILSDASVSALTIWGYRNI